MNPVGKKNIDQVIVRIDPDTGPGKSIVPISCGGHFSGIGRVFSRGGFIEAKSAMVSVFGSCKLLNG